MPWHIVAPPAPLVPSRDNASLASFELAVGFVLINEPVS